MALLGNPAAESSTPQNFNLTIKQEPPSSDSDIEEEEYVTPDIYPARRPVHVSAKVKKEESMSPTADITSGDDCYIDEADLPRNDKGLDGEEQPTDIPPHVLPKGPSQDEESSCNATSSEPVSPRNGTEAKRFIGSKVGKPKPSRKVHQCQYCPYSTDSGSTLRDHQRSHTGERPHKCGICQKCFARRKYLRAHLRLHEASKDADESRNDEPNSESRQNHICSTCGEVFDRASLLSKHMRTHGDQERSYECPECCKAYKYVGNLRTHMRTHTGERPYMCDVCGLRFTCSSYLQVHLRTHVRDKPYVCSECSKSFVHNSALSVHMRSHTGEQPYKCSHCDLRFSHLRNMKRHEICIHTRKFPHNCDICHKGFLIVTHWRQHMVTHKHTSQ